MNPTAPAAPSVAVHPPFATPAASACRNCDAPQVGEYCYACGQHFMEGRLSVRRLVRDFLTHKLSLEGGLVRTFKDLTIRPGQMIRDYVTGRRQRYTSPVAYLLIGAGLSGFLLPLWKEAYTAGLRSEDWGLERTQSEVFVQVMMAAQKNSTASTLLLCLFFVPLLRILFSKRISTAESFVFAFFVFGHLMILTSLLTPVAVAVSPDVYKTINDWGLFLSVLIVMGAAGGFFDTHIFTFVRMAAVLAVAVFSYAITILVFAVFWVLIIEAMKAETVAWSASFFPSVV